MRASEQSSAERRICVCAFNSRLAHLPPGVRILEFRGRITEEERKKALASIITNLL